MANVSVHCFCSGNWQQPNSNADNESAQWWARNTGNWLFSFQLLLFCHHVNVLRRMPDKISIFNVYVSVSLCVRTHLFQTDCDERCAYELPSSTTLVRWMGHFVELCVTIWRLLCFIHIQRLNLPIFTGPQWINAQQFHVSTWLRLRHWPYCELAHRKLMLQYI